MAETALELPLPQLPPLATVVDINLPANSACLSDGIVVQEPAPQGANETLVNHLVQDAAFSEAVRCQDVTAAAFAAVKRLQDELKQLLAAAEARGRASGSLGPMGGPSGMQHGHMGSMGLGMGMMMGGGLDGPNLHLPRAVAHRSSDLGGDLGAAAGVAARFRDIRMGEWMMVHSTNKSTDPEVVGQEGYVTKVETNGWVELCIPKLGRVVKLQQRYLAHLPVPPGGSSGACMPQHTAAATTPGPLGLGSSRQRAASSTVTAVTADGLQPSYGAYGRGLGAGEAISADDEDLGSARAGPYEPGLEDRHPQGFGPGRGPPLGPGSGRGPGSRVKEVVRAVRKELLTLEELVPWHLVESAWRVKRPTWRRGLRALQQEAAIKPPEQLVSPLASSMLELHTALHTDKSRGVFASGGPWEARLKELVEGGSGYLALAQCWEEMHAGIKAWLNSGASAAAAQQQGPALSGGFGGAGAGGAAAAGFTPPGGASKGGVGRPSLVTLHTAFSALESGGLKGDGHLGQVPLELILGGAGGTREALSALRGLLLREERHVQTAMEALAGQAVQYGSSTAVQQYSLSAELASLLSISADEWSGMSEGDRLALLLSSPGFRSELSSLKRIDSEPDTEGEEGGGEVTDMDESD